MNTWIIEPRDPLIARDGKPFGATAGAQASSLPFPLPSTTTGGVRTAAGLDNTGMFDANNIPQVMQIAVRGPLLVELGADSQIAQWLPPAPADALLLQINATEKRAADCHWLQPLELNDLELGNLPRDQTPDLLPVGLTPLPNALTKPFGEAPGFWFQQKFEDWLRDPARITINGMNVDELGISPLLQERRTHVRLDPETQTAADTALFATTGLAFEQPVVEYKTIDGKDERLHRPLRTHRLALAVMTEETPTSRLAPLGGERRLMRWHGVDNAWGMPSGLADNIADEGHCRLILLTPAIFADGWRPEWLLGTRHGVKATLKAAAVSRYQVVSGWDFAYVHVHPVNKRRGRPKPTRRLAPAGSVYYLSLTGTAQQRTAWLEETWMHCISDAEQDRLDGFGVAAIGSWSGVPAALEVN